MFYVQQIFFQKFAINYVMWKNTVEQATDDNVVHVHCMLCTYGYRHTHTHTHTDCVLFIAFPLQQWLHECATMLHYMYTNYLVNFRILSLAN